MKKVLTNKSGDDIIKSIQKRSTKKFLTRKEILKYHIYNNLLYGDMEEVDKRSEFHMLVRTDRLEI